MLSMPAWEFKPGWRPGRGRERDTFALAVLLVPGSLCRLLLLLCLGWDIAAKSVEFVLYPAGSLEMLGWRKGLRMSNASFFDVTRNRFRTAVAEVDRKWGWYLALGFFLVVLGVIASGMAVATTLLSVMALGWISLAAGGALIIHAFLTGKWSGFLLSLAAGALVAIAGIAMLSYPLASAAAITLMFGTILLAAGIFRSIASIVMQFPNWGWALLSGIVSCLLGAMLMSRWESAGLYFLGLLIGVDLIIHGLSWIMFSLKVHSLAGQLNIEESERRAA
jgi:uncharacterized membrane protein HdeD (DUF308 family)